MIGQYLVVGEMQKATDDNQHSAALIGKTNSFATALVKLLRLAKIIA